MMLNEITFVFTFLAILIVGTMFYTMTISMRLESAERNIKKLDELLLGEMKRLDKLEQEVQYSDEDLL